MLSIDEFIRQNFTSPVTREELLTELDITVQRLAQTAGCAEQGQKLRQLAAAAKQPLIVMVMGEFKSGKSTFINTLLGRQLLQTDATPATAVVTMLTGGSPEKVVAHRLDGTIKEYSFQDLPMLTAAGDKGQELRDQLEYVQITIDIPLLSRITLIDTPGLNDADKKRSAATKNFMDRADMVIWVFRPEVKRSEIAIMDKLPQHIKPLGIINRIDEIDDEDDDIDETVTNIRRSIGHRVSELYPLSAYQAQTSLCNEDIELYTASRWAEFLHGFGRLDEQASTIKYQQIIGEIMTVVAGWDEAETKGLAVSSRLIMLLVSLLNNLQLHNLFSEETKLAALSRLGIGYAYQVQQNKFSLFTDEITRKGTWREKVHWLGRGSSATFSQYIANQAQLYLEFIGDNNSSQGWLYLGKLYEHSSKYKDACECYKRSISKGNVEARDILYTIYASEHPQAVSAEDQFELGYNYDTGENIEIDYSKACYWYEKAAEQGFIEAQFNLALQYANGRGVVQDYERAAYWYWQAAYQGDSSAQNNLGCLYLHGQGVKKDVSKARSLYEKAAQQGNATAQKNLDDLIAPITRTAQITRPEPTTQTPQTPQATQTKQTVDELADEKRQAQQGCADAQFRLGLAYCKGEKIKQDYSKACLWLKRASRQGHITAQFALGTLYATGKGIEVNYNNALYWWGKAAEHNDIYAQYNLGVLYENGQSGEVDYSKASYWYKQAAKQGHRDAEKGVERVRRKIHKLWNNFNELERWANKGDVEAQFRLGVEYCKGERVNIDFVMARNWLRKAAENNDIDAQYNLGLLYEKGQGGAIDYRTAYYWYNQAGKQGHEVAKYRISCLRKEVRQNTKKTYSTPRKPFKKATFNLVELEQLATQGDADAQFKLGVLYENGRGVVKDYLKAYYWYEQAAKQGHKDSKDNTERLMDKMNRQMAFINQSQI